MYTTLDSTSQMDGLSLIKALRKRKATQDLPPSSPLSEGLLEKIRGANTEDIQSSPQWDNPDQTSKADPSQ